MARRKIPINEGARPRGKEYAKMTQGLRKKASELSVLTDARVALVCAPAAGARSPLVWESEGGGVLDRYRALPPEKRARHTHRSYLEAQLGKESATLARARQGACHGVLPDWDPALNDMTREEALEVLRAIDAQLRATGDRMAALGSPLAPAPEDDDASEDAVVAPQQLVGIDYDGFQTQMMPYHDRSDNHVGGEGPLEQFLMNPGYGLECVGGGGGDYDAGAVYDMVAPAGYGDNAGCVWPDLTMSYAADESWDAVMPVGYYPDFANDGGLAPEHYYAQDVTGGAYASTLQLEYPLGMNDNFAYLDMDNSYAASAHWQVEEFQSCDIGTGHYQYHC
ncbi:uncharacterized protein [Lolium perenne]|uniref:uncharacterized protein n=1 Tax=Lolium perenne TaxID=4522 RepID=UPI0021EA5394|nr:uncharacterized protein LOC127348613 [Lolium perenne]